MELVEKYIHGLFVLWGIRFVSVIDHVDTNVKGNKKSRQINALINEWYVEDLSENIRAVFRRKMKDGQFLGSFAPYGYQKDVSDRHKLVIDAEAADVVKNIFQLYLQGNGMSAIANILTEHEIPTPTQYKSLKGFAYKNFNSRKYSRTLGVWSVNTVRRILTSKTYIGQLVQGRERKVSYKSKKIVTVPESEWIVVENNHPPIIEEKNFDMVQKLIKSRRKISSSKQKGQWRFLLAGKVKCFDCGATMEKGSPTRDGKSCYLRCALSHKTKSKICTSHSIRLDVLIETLERKIQFFLSVFVNNDVNLSIIERHLQSEVISVEKIEEKKAEIKSSEAKITELSHIIAVAFGDKVRGCISEEDFKSIKEHFELDMKKQKKRIKHLLMLIEEMQDQSRLHYEKDAWIQELLCRTSITHEVINGLVDCIYIKEKKEGEIRQVVVHWIL